MMNAMLTMTRRNLKLFFRDRVGVFMSLLAVGIIIVLYAVFLGDIWLGYVDDVPGVGQLRDSWLGSGLLTTTSVTSALGAFSWMVKDRVDDQIRDLLVAPIRRSAITAGYFANALLIGIMMTVIVLVFILVYLVVVDAFVLSFEVLLGVFGVIILSTFSNTAMIVLLVSFIKSSGAFSTLSTIVGTFVGFIAGIYLPIGSLPQGVQFVMKLFPVTYSASLFRDVLMAPTIESSLVDAPEAVVGDFKTFMGVEYEFWGQRVTTTVSIVILSISTVIFFTLAVVNMRRNRT